MKDRTKWRPEAQSKSTEKRRKAKEERKERRHSRKERRERKKGVDGVVEEDQQGRGNWKHKSDEEGR